ncbi:MAG: P27 family phage terminase small subunit [Vicinamibacteria bacterium]
MKSPKTKKTGPKMPEHVADDVRAAAEWTRLTAALKRCGNWSEDDASLIEAAALSYGEYRRCLASMPDGKPTYQTEGGRIFGHPAQSMAADASRRWSGSLIALGLAPTARRRAVPGVEAKPDPKLAQYARKDGDRDPREMLDDPREILDGL